MVMKVNNISYNALLRMLNSLQQLGADMGVGVIQHALANIQGPLFRKDGLGDAQLADVVH